MGYLRVEEGELLLELLVGNDEVHGLAGDVDLAVLGHLEAVVDDALHGGGALLRAGEGRATGDEAGGEVLSEHERGVGVGELSEAVVFGLALELGSLLVALVVTHLRPVHDGLQGLAVVLRSGESLSSSKVEPLPG